jgi:MFS family permease
MSSERPTRYRFVILGLLCLLAMITYMDRAANGSAKKAIMAELSEQRVLDGLEPYSEDDFFIVLMAFQLAYAAFEIPSGWLGDTRGPRATLLRVVIWWSIFVALSGLTGMTLPGGFYVGFVALIVIQFLFGMGEAGAFPNITKALYNWFPASDRGFAKSTIWMFARLMGGLTPLLWVLVTSENFAGLTWRQALWLFAGIAVVWSVAFYFIFKNKPSEHPRVNAAEVALIDAGRTQQTTAVRVPWTRLLTSRNLLCVCLMYVVTNFCWYFLMYNLPGKLRTMFETTRLAANPEWKASIGEEVIINLLAGMPLIVGMLGCFAGGWLSDRIIRKTQNRKWGRRVMGMVGYASAGCCYLVAMNVQNDIYLFAFLLILMGFCNDLIMAPAWAVCQDIGQEYSGTVAGAMNMFGNLVGAVSGILYTGLVMKMDILEEAKITTLFTTYAAVYFVGVLLWLMIDASKPVAPNEPEPQASDAG